MTGKVFVSCGQRPPEETEAAVRRLLRDEFDLIPYVASSVRSLGDITGITNELRSADYYLFIDFVRRKHRPYDYPMSLFTHQELALAHHLGFQEQVIALQQKGAPIEGFIEPISGEFKIVAPTESRTSRNGLKACWTGLQPKSSAGVRCLWQKPPPNECMTTALKPAAGPRQPWTGFRRFLEDHHMAKSRDVRFHSLKPLVARVCVKD
jgi:hypothetical protein